MVSADFADRPIKKLVLFDVDGTLTPARQKASPEVIHLLRELLPVWRSNIPYHEIGDKDIFQRNACAAAIGTIIISA